MPWLAGHGRASAVSEASRLARREAASGSVAASLGMQSRFEERGKRCRWLTAWFMLAVWLGACSGAPSYEGTLKFRRAAQEVKALSLNLLVARHGLRVVESFDPYYGQSKRFRGFSLGPALADVYALAPAALRQATFVLSALDGYAVPIAGERLLDDGAFVAVDDVDIPGFAPIGPRKISPLPAYLVWQGRGKNNLETHPRPWQLSTIDLVPSDTLYPHARPHNVPHDSPALRGFALFRERCIRCHAINREGGSVGPELNVPQSIVSYRPEEQIRAYIRDPLTFRYGAMPANPDLSDADLDALIAYFRAMARDPYDPATEKP